MKHFVRLSLIGLFLTPLVWAQNASPKVLASVHPLALMAASVVPAENLTVLLPKGMTPHDFSLRPSDVKAIQNADIIVWTGPIAEPYLASFAKRWPTKLWLNVGPDEAPATHDHHDDAHHHDHDHQQDRHWWFSPSLMVQAQAQLAQALGRDGGDFAKQVEQAQAQIRAELQPVQHRGFFVFHQAYDHWVTAFGLNQLGAFTLSPERKPGAKTLAAMRKQLQQGAVVCVFSEPQFSPALIDSVTQGLAVKRAELDPMAANIALTADGYVRFMHDLAQRFKNCLVP